MKKLEDILWVIVLELFFLIAYLGYIFDNIIIFYINIIGGLILALIRLRVLFKRFLNLKND